MRKGLTPYIITAIFVLCLAAAAGYLWYRERHENTEPDEAFLIKFGEANLEKALQEKSPAEIATTGAVKVPILVYHSVRPQVGPESSVVDYYDIIPELLEKQLQYLKDNNFTVISLEDLYQALENGKNLPPKPVILTFDDGWKNQYKYAFPLLKKYGATATFFVFTNAIDHPHFLSWKQLQEMGQAGMTIGGHTRSHPFLVKIKDKNLLKDEIAGGKKILEVHLGKSIDFFAYPFGHYNDLIISVVKEAGFKMARSTYKGVFHAKENIFKLKSIEVTDDFDALIKELNKPS